MTRENGNGSADAFHSLDGPAPISVPRIAGNPPDLTFLVTIIVPELHISQRQLREQDDCQRICVTSHLWHPENQTKT